MNASQGFESLCANPEAFLMFDSLHPSAATHALMGELALSAVPLPPMLPVFALALAGLGLVRRSSRTREIIPAK